MGWVILIAGLCLSLLTAMMRGWALSLLWEWFAVPVFALPALGFSQAVGVALLVGFAARSPGKPESTKPMSEYARRLAENFFQNGLFYPLLVLLIAQPFRA